MFGGVTDNAISGTGAGSELTNVNNTIIGTGTIGNSLNFINGANGTVETNPLGQAGGTINFVAPTGTSFTNNGSIIAGNQGSLIFGQDHSAEGFTNNSLIAIEGAGSTTSLVIAGQVGFMGTGEIELVDSGFTSNVITSDGKVAELTTSIPIEGSGTIGDFEAHPEQFFDYWLFGRHAYPQYRQQHHNQQRQRHDRLGLRRRGKNR